MPSLPQCPSPVTSGPLGSSETPISHPKTSLPSVVFLQKHSEKCFGEKDPLLGTCLPLYFCGQSHLCWPKAAIFKL